MNMNGFLEVIRTSRLTMSDDELLQAVRLLNDERRLRKERKAGTMKMTLQVGDTVFFTDSKKGVIKGKVQKVKYKKAIVETNGSTGYNRWDVPLGMLRYTE